MPEVVYPTRVESVPARRRREVQRVVSVARVTDGVTRRGSRGTVTAGLRGAGGRPQQQDCEPDLPHRRFELPNRSNRYASSGPPSPSYASCATSNPNGSM